MGRLEEIVERDKYLLPCVRRMFPEDPILLVEAKGATVKDSTGKEYIDLFASHGLNTMVGYNHPKVVAAIKSQAEKLISCSIDFHTAPAVELAEKLAQITPTPLKRCFFANAGTEAVECSLYLAKKYTKKYEIIALYGGFHGRTYGSRSALGWSAYKHGLGPFLPGFIHIPSYYCYRCSLGLKYPECDLQCAKMLDDALKYQCAGDVAAFIAEPIQGTAGNIPAPEGYFKEVKKVLDAHGILFISDEVYTGLGRTGKLFGFEHYGVQPDIMTLSKALGGGVPISAVIASEEVAAAFAAPEPVLYFTTYGSNPLCCAAAIASINTILEEKLYKRAAKLGDYFIRGLNDLAEEHELIGDVRGKGLMIGVELVKDRKTKEPAREESKKLRNEAKKRGVILPAGLGWFGNTIELHPPVVITEEQIDKVLNVLDESLKVIE